MNADRLLFPLLYVCYVYYRVLVILQRPTWPTDTGINEEEAEKFCKEFIQKSPAFEVCKDVGVGVTDAVENCMEDILVRLSPTQAEL